MLIQKRILTVSSANMDFVMSVSKIPQGGETQLENGTYQFVPGGKGANSAVAVRRLGGDSVFCCRLGKDANGSIMHNIYKKEGLDTRFITIDPNAVTGLGAIMVEPNGQNRIILFPGANVRLTKDDPIHDLLSFYIGKNTFERQNFIINNLVVEEDVE